MKHIKDTIEEAYGNYSEFLVAFSDFKDNDGFPISCKIQVNRSVEKDFAKFLESEEGGIFAHADGPGVEY